eukprot:TRINITY_DN6280_c0_g1_i1.p1 TRINITY_DN6280_c0_g1~~TRINITY_DN6280_c0_g1_i1.p1  ORF type:complete len:323 (-),score=51.25 TRINITY_DN6280_c0_g1_i1:59-1027(-)
MYTFWRGPMSSAPASPAGRWVSAPSTAQSHGSPTLEGFLADPTLLPASPRGGHFTSGNVEMWPPPRPGLLSQAQAGLAKLEVPSPASAWQYANRSPPSSPMPGIAPTATPEFQSPFVSTPARQPSNEAAVASRSEIDSPKQPNLPSQSLQASELMTTPTPAKEVDASIPVNSHDKNSHLRSPLQESSETRKPVIPGTSSRASCGTQYSEEEVQTDPSYVTLVAQLKAAEAALLWERAVTKRLRSALDMAEAWGSPCDDEAVTRSSATNFDGSTTGRKSSEGHQAISSESQESAEEAIKSLKQAEANVEQLQEKLCSVEPRRY